MEEKMTKPKNLREYVLGKGTLDEIKKIGDETLEKKLSLSEEEFKALANPSLNLDEIKEKNKEIFKEIYRTLIDILKQYVDMKEEYYSIVSLWIMGTYMHKIFLTYPYLFFNAMKGSGKSRTLSLIAHLSYKGKLVVNMSDAVLFRTAQDSTICIDEFERVRGKEKANLRELLNSAYKKGVCVERMRKVKDSKSEKFEIERFDVFSPIAMANISGMDEVLGDRSIHLILEKSTLNQISRKLEIWGLEPLIRQILKKLVQCSEVLTLKSNIHKLYIEYNTTLNTNDTTLHYSTHKNIINKILSSSLNGRHLELFFPLFIIADMCDELDNVVEIAEKIIKEKREEDVYENRDVSLIDFISRQPDKNEWIPQKNLLNEFKNFIEVEDDKWLNNQWFGIALNRLNLLNDKRRLGKGIEIILNIQKAKDKIRMFK